MAIATLVTAGLSMLILYVYYTRTEYLFYKRKERLQTNLELGINIILTNYAAFDYDQLTNYDLLGDRQDSIFISRSKWGLLDIVEIGAFHLQDTLKQKIAIVHELDNKAKGAIHLIDDGRPLTIAGDTKLTGDCFLPVSGVQTGFVGRVGYTNDKLIYGEEKRSEKELPEVSLKETFKWLEDQDLYESEFNIDSVVWSFYQEPMLVEKSDTMSRFYKGNIVIRSDDRLVIGPKARTRQIIAYAPVIEFLPGFEGEGQFFATDTIIVRKDVSLQYPSILAVYNEDDISTIYVESQAVVNGYMMIAGGQDGFRRRIIHLQDDSTFEGMMYCNGLAELYGDILGHVTTKRFLVNSQNGVAENFLFNASINFTEMDTSFLALSEWFFEEKASVLEYLE